MEGDPRAGSPRLLVLGAGPAQLGLLEAARARGLWMAVVDRDPAAPGFRLADRRCILSTEDEPAIERLVAALEHRRDRSRRAPTGRSESRRASPSGSACRIRSTPATAVLATNKLRQRERLAEAGVPQPRWWVVGGGDERLSIEAPCVVKAPDRQGQKGLTLVEDAARAARRGRRPRERRRATALALVEELVDGPEVTVIGFSVDGEFTRSQ